MILRDGRIRLAIALLGVSSAVAFVAPWWTLATSRGPLFVAGTLMMGALLSAAAISKWPGTALVTIAAGAGLTLASLRPGSQLVLVVFGPLYGGAASEIARIARALRRERPLLAVADAALFAGGILIVGAAPWALVSADGPAGVASGVGVVVLLTGLLSRLRSESWLRSITRDAAVGFSVRRGWDTPTLPQWSLFRRRRRRPVVLVQVRRATPYRSTEEQVAIIAGPCRGDDDRWALWNTAAIACGIILVTICGIGTAVVTREYRTHVMPKLSKQNARATRIAAEYLRDANRDRACPTIADVAASALDAATNVDDAWGTPLRIECVDADVVVTSAGMDKRFGTADDIVVGPRTSASSQPP